MRPRLSTIEEALDALKGRPVRVTDDEDRENEATSSLRPRRSRSQAGTGAPATAAHPGNRGEPNYLLTGRANAAIACSSCGISPVAR